MILNPNQITDNNKSNLIQSTVDKPNVINFTHTPTTNVELFNNHNDINSSQSEINNLLDLEDLNINYNENRSYEHSHIERIRHIMVDNSYDLYLYLRGLNKSTDTDQPK